MLPEKLKTWVILLLVVVLVGCTSTPVPLPSVSAVSIESPTATIFNQPLASIPTPTLSAPLPTEMEQASLPAVQMLTVLYTNDEHGWMQGMQPGQGAAELMGLWEADYGYTPGGPFLVLSGGDNWTGPAISTWFEGESMVDVMNSMGYAASTIGNHEFDFGLEALAARLDEADFPYLSANLRRKSDASPPLDLGIQPYTIVDVAGVKVGLIGLTLTNTPKVTNPVNVVDFNFIPYEQALREAVPQVRQAGAELIMVPAHVCLDELRPLARAVADLGISLFGAGHCNEFTSFTESGAVVLAGGYHDTSYAYAQFLLDPQTHQVLDVTYGTHRNQGGNPDPEVASVIDRWAQAADAELNQPIGYLKRKINRQSREMQALITESWVLGYPNADAALTNLGGMRADLPAGELTLADLISVMPFDNVLVEIKLTGAQLIEVITQSPLPPAVGGVSLVGGNWRLHKSGEPLQMDQTYSVLVNDFMYAGGDDYTLLAQFDPRGYNTAIDWRQPVIDWILAQHSTDQQPLDEAIAALSR